MNSKTIGIIGISGKYGQWFKQFFTEQGSKVIGSDLDTTFTNQQVVEQSDIVVFAVPIRDAVAIIERVVPFSQPHQVWMDLTSLKELAIDAMLQSSASVVGLHPLCAPPSTHTLKDQNLVVCQSRVDDRWKPWLESFLQATQAKIQYSTPHHHDKMMVTVQALPHLLHLIMGGVVRDMQDDREEVKAYATPVFENAIATLERMLRQHPALFADIQIDNTNTLAMIEHVQKNLDLLRNMIVRNDKELFEKHFAALKGFW